MRFQKDCPHCEPKSFALKHPLMETDNFRAVCDVHPLVEGHILIIPKEHLSCVGVFSESLFLEFKKLYRKVSTFLSKKYGPVAVFEHGVIGQTVFHSHVHFLPFKGSIKDIVPEPNVLRSLNSLDYLRDIFQKEKKYLFVALDDKFWTVNSSIGTPRFFRDRFSRALGVPERGDWKKMRTSSQLMKTVEEEIKRLKEKWTIYCK